MKYIICKLVEDKSFKNDIALLTNPDKNLGK